MMVLGQLMQEVNYRKDSARVVPVSMLKVLKQEMEQLAAKENINTYQQFLIEDMFQYDIPDLDFEVHSLIIVAAACKKGRVVFQYKDKKIPLILPPTYWDYSAAHKKVKQYLYDLLWKNQFHIELAHNLPCKLLAVKSGLAEYGRNNICYVKGMGSYFNLIALYTDLESDNEANEFIYGTNEFIYENKEMDICKNCKKCLKHCPTGAISEEHFLINTDKCVTFHNEAGIENPFPEWMPTSVHNAMVGCTICQDVCPLNIKYRDNITELMYFSEEETGLLLEGVIEEELPEGIKEKLGSMEMLGYLGALSRNLKVLL